MTITPPPPPPPSLPNTPPPTSPINASLYILYIYILLRSTGLLQFNFYQVIYNNNKHGGGNVDWGKQHPGLQVEMTWLRLE